MDSEEIREGETPEVNSLVTPIDSQKAVALMGEHAEGAITITRREYVRLLDIRDVAQTYIIQINPGYNGSFPWLSGMAANFQKYTITGMAHEYVPVSGLAVSSTNAALGFVSMGYQYNVAELQTGSEWPVTQARGILNLNGSVSMSPGAVGTTYLECDPSKTNQPVKFVYTGEIQALQYSQANYDWAYLLVRTEGSQNTTQFTCGQLWVTYQIHFFDPRPQDPTLSLVDGNVKQLIEELRLLREFQGPMTDQGQVRYATRIDELCAILTSPEFVKERSKQVQEGLLAGIEGKDQEPDCPALDERLKQLHPPGYVPHSKPLPFQVPRLETPVAPTPAPAYTGPRGNWVVAS